MPPKSSSETSSGAMLEDHLDASVIANLTSTVVDKRVVHAPGVAGGFDHMLTVEDLADLLSRLIVYPGMMRVEDGEKLVSESDYLTSPISEFDNKRRVKTAAIEKLLSTGATLVMDHCDGLFPGVSRFCGSIAKWFRCPVGATLFLVLAEAKPTHFHWDNHDLLVCQVIGKKFWPIYPPVQMDPLHSRATHRLSDAQPMWQGVVKGGDLLYVPRGWPHHPVAESGTSLHVVYDIARPTGADFVHFLTTNILEGIEIRRDVPSGLSTEDRRRYAATMRDVILKSLTDEVFSAWYLSSQSRAIDRRSRLADVIATVRPPRSH